MPSAAPTAALDAAPYASPYTASPSRIVDALAAHGAAWAEAARLSGYRGALTNASVAGYLAGYTPHASATVIDRVEQPSKAASSGAERRSQAPAPPLSACALRQSWSLLLQAHLLKLQLPLPFD